MLTSLVAATLLVQSPSPVLKPVFTVSGHFSGAGKEATYFIHNEKERAAVLKRHFAVASENRTKILNANLKEVVLVGHFTGESFATVGVAVEKVLNEKTQVVIKLKEVPSSFDYRKNDKKPPIVNSFGFVAIPRVEKPIVVTMQNWNFQGAFMEPKRIARYVEHLPAKPERPTAPPPPTKPKN